MKTLLLTDGNDTLYKGILQETESLADDDYGLSFGEDSCIIKLPKIYTEFGENGEKNKRYWPLIYLLFNQGVITMRELAERGVPLTPDAECDIDKLFYAYLNTVSHFGESKIRMFIDAEHLAKNDSAIVEQFEALIDSPFVRGGRRTFHINVMIKREERPFMNYLTEI